RPWFHCAGVDKARRRRLHGNDILRNCLRDVCSACRLRGRCLGGLPDAAPPNLRRDGNLFIGLLPARTGWVCFDWTRLLQRRAAECGNLVQGIALGRTLSATEKPGQKTPVRDFSFQIRILTGCRDCRSKLQRVGWTALFAAQVLVLKPAFFLEFSALFAPVLPAVKPTANVQPVILGGFPNDP